MQRNPNRQRRSRRQETDLQVVEDIQVSNTEHTEHTEHTDDNIIKTQQDKEPTSLRASSSMAHEHEQQSPCELQYWKASTGEYATTCELFQTDDTDFTCPITHEPTCSAIAEDLPATWLLPGNTCANTVRLLCSHTFLLLRYTSSQPTCDGPFEGQGLLCSWIFFLYLRVSGTFMH
jgi:hypothetical protein